MYIGNVLGNLGLTKGKGAAPKVAGEDLDRLLLDLVDNVYLTRAETLEAFAARWNYTRAGLRRVRIRNRDRLERLISERAATAA